MANVSAVTALKLLHERDERLDSLERHRIVEAGAHAAYRAVALQVREPGGGRFAQKCFIELGLRECEGYVHPRAGVLRHRITVKPGTVDGLIQRVRLGAVALAYGGEPAQGLEPLEHEAGEIP